MHFEHSRDYLAKYETLKNGYYEYKINGEYYKHIYTEFEDRSGWMRVSVIDWSNKEHINADEVWNVKLSDNDINILLSKDHTYSIKAVAEIYKWPFNEWIRYPHCLYVHNSIEKFSSIDYAKNIKNSNLVSLDDQSDPILVDQHSADLGFGSSQGDTFFAYGGSGDVDLGLFQSFSGPGRGAVFVR